MSLWEGYHKSGKFDESDKFDENGEVDEISSKADIWQNELTLVIYLTCFLKSAVQLVCFSTC